MDKEPDWKNSNQWNEYDWEKAFRFSEKMTQRYFQLLGRFGDLPDSEQLIARELGDPEFLYGGEEETSAKYHTESKDPLERPEIPREIGPGDPLFFEVCPVFLKARQLALGWSNVLSTILSPNDRLWGLRVLFYCGRILSYLAMSINDGTFERIDGSIAFAKRVITQVDLVLGEINQKEKISPEYIGMFKLVRELVLETHHMAVSYLMELRDRKKKGNFGDHP